ncbi:uncharacterized protein LOC135500685 isoform X2 [Lineus longissimus]|uniref:uncharacterized protein LOC135500685 isoform X2 n=1 Tax=Lineus longissimus TaxID=88925 RepID=UPI002B4CB11C
MGLRTPLSLSPRLLIRCIKTVARANEKLVNRLYYAKLMLKLYKKERRYLMGKLDDIGDNFRDVQVPVMWEEGPSIEELLGQPLLDLATGSCIGVHSENQHSDGQTDEGATASATPMSPKKTKFEIKYEKELGLLTPVLPRKPVHVFVMFSDQHKDAIRVEYKDEHGTDIDQHELSRILAEKWNSLSMEEKAIYQEMYEKEKLRYERRLREYELLKGDDPTLLSSACSVKKEIKKEVMDS